MDKCPNCEENYNFLEMGHNICTRCGLSLNDAYEYKKLINHW